MSKTLAVAASLAVVMFGRHTRLRADGCTFSTIDAPGAKWTAAFGINGAGQIVGAFGPNGTSNRHGFLRTIDEAKKAKIDFTLAIGDIDGAVGFANQHPSTAPAVPPSTRPDFTPPRRTTFSRRFASPTMKS